MKSEAQTMADFSSWLDATQTSQPELPSLLFPLAHRVLCVVEDFPLQQFILFSVTPNLPS